MGLRVEHLHGELADRHARAARGRHPGEVTTIVLQQSGVVAEADRFKRAPIHFLVDRKGMPYQLHPFSRRLPTAVDCLSSDDIEAKYRPILDARAAAAPGEIAPMWRGSGMRSMVELLSIGPSGPSEQRL